jgi:hypothetical protein
VPGVTGNQAGKTATLPAAKRTYPSRRSYAYWPPKACVAVPVPVPGRGASLYAFRLATTMLAKAHRMPMLKITVPKTKTCGGMPTLVAP